MLEAATELVLLMGKQTMIGLLSLSKMMRLQSTSLEALMVDMVGEDSLMAMIQIEIEVTIMKEEMAQGTLELCQVLVLKMLIEMRRARMKKQHLIRLLKVTSLAKTSLCSEIKKTLQTSLITNLMIKCFL
jgi:hypothetical protein